MPRQLLLANPMGAAAVVLSLGAFVLAHHQLRHRSVTARSGVTVLFALLSTPALLFGIYYLHILPEHACFYTLRSWRGSELLVVFLGAAAGAFASLLPRSLLVVPLFGLVAVGAVPHLKPVLGRIPDEVFSER